jgi:hypothetical protein
MLGIKSSFERSIDKIGTLAVGIKESEHLDAVLRQAGDNKEKLEMIADKVTASLLPVLHPPLRPFIMQPLVGSAAGHSSVQKKIYAAGRDQVVSADLSFFESVHMAEIILPLSTDKKTDTQKFVLACLEKQHTYIVGDHTLEGLTKAYTKLLEMAADQPKLVNEIVFESLHRLDDVRHKEKATRPTAEFYVVAAERTTNSALKMKAMNGALKVLTAINPEGDRWSTLFDHIQAKEVIDRLSNIAHGDDQGARAGVYREFAVKNAFKGEKTLIVAADDGFAIRAESVSAAKDVTGFRREGYATHFMPEDPMRMHIGNVTDAIETGALKSTMSRAPRLSDIFRDRTARCTDKPPVQPLPWPGLTLKSAPAAGLK